MFLILNNLNFPRHVVALCCSTFFTNTKDEENNYKADYNETTKPFPGYGQHTHCFIYINNQIHIFCKINQHFHYIFHSKSL